MTGVKTNERPGTRAVLKHYRMSATKVRQVLDLIRGEDITAAHEILISTPREGARVVDKVLHSAVSNAVEMTRQQGGAIDPEELYVSACYADEGTTIKRWRPRARGRATRIRKRTSHITVIVSRMDDEKIARLRAKRTEATAALRSRRVAASRLRRRSGEDTEAGDAGTGGRRRRGRGGAGSAADTGAGTDDEVEDSTGDLDVDDSADTDVDAGTDTDSDTDAAHDGDATDAVDTADDVDATGAADENDEAQDGSEESDAADDTVASDDSEIEGSDADDAVQQDGDGETD
jgi:large subunit ribosomal protein L22